MSKENVFRVGCANEVINVNLFTELSGYGSFRGRRNRGVHDNLHCRVASFNIHDKRFILITNDLLFMDRKASREIRERLSSLYALRPESVMICCSHTHSAPLIAPCPGLAELDYDFRTSWIETVVEVVGRAIQDETPVLMAGGRAPITQQFGINRIDKNGPVDEQIRWSTFKRYDGTTKLLIYNHGLHAVVFGANMLSSADWPGAVNSLILEKKLAENVLFLQGACGDINPVECCKELKEGEVILENLSQAYSADIEKGLKNPEFQDKTPTLDISMEEVKLPCQEYSTDDLRQVVTAMKKQDLHPGTRDRIEEIIIMMEKKISIDMITDLQVVRLGDLYFYAVPGELFFLLGKELMKRSPGKLTFVSEVTNDNCSYIPTPESFNDDNTLLCNKPIDYGSYETLFVNFQFLKLPYKKTAGEYLVGKMIDMAKKLEKEII